MMNKYSEEIWNDNYRGPGETTIEDTWKRLAIEAAKIENKEIRKQISNEFYSILNDFKFIPGGRIMANLGIDTRHATTLMNCISGNTKIHTDIGIFYAKELSDTEVNVLSEDGMYRPAKWYSYGNQELYKITLENEDELYATAEHEWVIRNNKGGWKRVKTVDLENSFIPLVGITNFNYDELDYLNGVRHGLVFGDGWLYMSGKYSMLRQYGDSKHLIEDYFESYTKSVDHVYLSVTHLENKLKSLPSLQESKSYLRGFIAGYIGADGHVDINGHVMLHCKDKEVLQEIRTICTYAGLPTTNITLVRTHSPFDGSYKPLWKLSLVKKYMYDEKMIIKNSHKQNMFNSKVPEKYTSIKVVSIENMNTIEEVFCCVEEETHTMVIDNCYLTGQCYVHHPKDINYKDPDSIEGIYTMLKAQAHTLKSEGGYGMNFSWIRPAGSYVKGIGSRTPGVLHFMELWDVSSKIITMGSEKILGELHDDEKTKIRKGAQMAVLSVWHPEIEDYIIAKQTPGRLTKFNMSIGVTTGFMKAVENDEDWQLIFPDTEHPKYEDEWKGDIKDWKSKGYKVIVYKTVKAKDLWETISYATYTRNEPGVIFLDLFNKLNALSYAEDIFATNPCGEIGMATGVCNLGSLNLTKFVKLINNKLEFDYDEYARCVKLGVRYLDNINDISRAPLKEYKDSMTEKRRIGLGNMGLGSLMLMFGIRYGSEESLELIKNIYKLKAETELLASAQLGKEKGSFKLFDKEKYFSTYWWNNLKISPSVKQEIENIGYMRNSHHSMNAPNGNTSIYAGIVTGGIEPSFMLEYTRWAIVTENEKRSLKRKGFTWPDPLKGEWFETEHVKFFIKGDEQILKGTFENIDYEVDKNRGLVKAVLVSDYGWEFAKNYYKDKLLDMQSKGIFASAMDLSVTDHINVLKVVAHYTNMNNSKTVNLPSDYPYEDFKSLYLDAWKSNIKGLTTYRAGTMTAVLETRKVKIYQNELERQFAEAGDKVIQNVGKIPNEYFARGFKIKDNGRKKWYINLAFVDEAMTRPYAMFVSTNNIESTEVTEELVKSMEKLLTEKGLPKKLIEEQITKYENQKNTTRIARIIGMALRHNLKIQDVVEILDKYPHELSSFVFYLSKLLSRYIQDGTKVKKEKCPSCKTSTIIYQDGCKTCINCGWSKC